MPLHPTCQRSSLYGCQRLSVQISSHGRVRPLLRWRRETKNTQTPVRNRSGFVCDGLWEARGAPKSQMDPEVVFVANSFLEAWVTKAKKTHSL